MKSTFLPRDYIDQRQERTLFSIPSKSLIHCIINICEIALAFLCSTVNLILFITSKCLYTDGKFSEGGSFDLAPQSKTECGT